MSTSTERYTTSKLILRDDEAVSYIKMLVGLLEEESNLHSGHFSSSFYIEFIPYGDRAYKFIIDGLLDSGPELKLSAVYPGLEADNQSSSGEDEESGEMVDLFLEIQKNLAEDSWFFVENHSVEKNFFSSSIFFYHQDGRKESIHSHDIKKSILRKLEI
jgi:hypothetical protein